MIKKTIPIKIFAFIGFTICISSCRNEILDIKPASPNGTPTNTAPPPLAAPAPITQLKTSPSPYWAGETASFSFESTIHQSTFECNLDQNGFQPCSSPYVFSQAIGTGGSHSVQIQATSPIGIVEITPLTFNWVQENYNSIALFHFDALSSSTDSSLYTNTLSSLLTNTTTSSTTGVSGFSEGQSFSESTHMSTSHNSAHSLAISAMTLEGFFKFNNLPKNMRLMPLASQSGTSGQYGWEFGIVRWGTYFYLYFIGSQDGITRVEVESPTTLGNLGTITAGTWYHFAMTWDQGTDSVTFYKNGVSFGSASIGFAQNPIFDSHADFRLGFVEDASLTANYPNSDVGGVLQYFNGSIDEFRWSQMVRPISVPTAPLVGD